MIRLVVVSVLLLASAIALTLTVAQGPFDESSFAFQQYRDYSGTVFASPAPTLATADGWFLLTRPGKFGVNAGEWHGRQVHLRGALIQSGRNQMLEVEPGSIRSAPGAPQTPPPGDYIGWMELTGEIADGKCYYGVMNPGRGKVHRDCAVRCLSGGAPPVFLVRDSAGALQALLLTGIGREILDYVAEPVRLRGELRTTGPLPVFKAIASSLRRE